MTRRKLTRARRGGRERLSNSWMPAEALGLQAYSREDVDAQTAESKGLELRV